jgi:hypothetical protein
MVFLWPAIIMQTSAIELRNRVSGSGMAGVVEVGVGRFIYY